MIRVVSMFCVGLLGFTCFANYRVSEQTRIARQDLIRTEKRISQETRDLAVLELQWQKLSNPAVVQRLAEAHLGMQSAPSLQLASVRELRRRGGALNDEPIRAANAEAEAESDPVIKATMRNGM